MQHFIWVFPVCQSTVCLFTSIQNEKGLRHIERLSENEKSQQSSNISVVYKLRDITVFKIFIFGGILSDMRSKI